MSNSVPVTVPVVSIPSTSITRSTPVKAAKVTPQPKVVTTTPVEDISVNDEFNEDYQNETINEDLTSEPDFMSDDIPLTDVDADNSSCEVENPETKINTSEYFRLDVSEKDKLAGRSLADEFAAFVKDTKEIVPEGKIKSVLPTGIDLLDTILGGGFGTKFCQVVGLTGGGKSALAGRLIATGQKKWPGKFLTAYIDSEETMNEERLEQLGCDPHAVKIYTQVSVEKVFKIVEAVAAFKEKHKELMEYPSLIIWDSIANTHTEKALDTENLDQVLGQKARVLSHMLPKYISYLNKYNICMFAINQLREKIDINQFARKPADLRMLPDKSVPGGGSILYNSFQLLNVRQTKLEETYGFPGIMVSIRSVKNKLFTPNVEIELVFSFEHGFSSFWTNYELLKKTKRITAGGGWVKIKGYESAKFRQSDTIQQYRKDPEFRKVWDDNVRDVLKEEYIDKYKGNHREMIEV